MMISPVALGLDDAGDIVYQSPISGSTVTTFALLRYQSSAGQSNLVAYNCEAAPGTSGAFCSQLGVRHHYLCFFVWTIYWNIDGE
jgi:hypothetical protein